MVLYPAWVGGPGRVRTRDMPVKSRPLYLAELQAHSWFGPPADRGVVQKHFGMAGARLAPSRRRVGDEFPSDRSADFSIKVAGKSRRQCSNRSNSPRRSMRDQQSRELGLQRRAAVELVFKGAAAPPCRVAVPATVYPPREDTELLDAALAELRIPPEARLLEIGCGCGAAAIAAALRGMRVVACDVNPLAVAASRGNAARAGVGDRIDVVEGGIGEDGSWPDGVSGPFDVICWNTPYLDGGEQSDSHDVSGPGRLGPLEDAGLLDLAGESGWTGMLLNALVARPDALAEGGVVLLVHADTERGELAQTRWRRKGFATRALARVRLGGDERLTAFAAWVPWNGLTPEWDEKVGSTNTRLLNSGAVAGERLFAKSQTQGRGQRDRNWVMRQGDFAGSWALDLPDDRQPGDIGDLQLKAALSVAEAVACTLELPLTSTHWTHAAALSERGVAVRWPNDIWLPSGKAAGCLVEGRQQGEQNSVVLGIGVNLPTGASEQHEFPLAGLSQLEGFSCGLEEFSRFLDASVASLFECNPVVPDASNTLIRRSLWALMTRWLADGRCCRGKAESWGRPVGLDGGGGLRVVNPTGVMECRDVAGLEWSSHQESSSTAEEMSSSTFEGS